MNYTAEDMTINTSTPTSTNISRAFAAAFFAAVALVCSSCDTNMVVGAIETQQGELLPGVVVTVQGTRFQAMSNAQGIYKVRHAGGPLVLHYFKTGYAPGILEPETSPDGRIEAATLRLWRLPVSHGVWLYDNYTYTRARPVEPERVTLTDGRITYGVTRPSDVSTDVEIPFIVIFGRLPTYNIALSRLDMVEAPLEDLENQTAIYWIPVQDIPISARPLDEPEGKLTHVRLFEPLKPGNYAVHWGALKEQSPLDSRAYLFNVLGDMPKDAPPDAEGESAKPQRDAEDDVVDFEDEPNEAPAGQAADENL